MWGIARSRRSATMPDFSNVPLRFWPDEDLRRKRAELERAAKLVERLTTEIDDLLGARQHDDERKTNDKTGRD